MKTCTRCKEVKSVTEFGIRKASSDGLNYYCKLCIKALNDRNSTTRNAAAKMRRRVQRLGTHNLDEYDYDYIYC